MNQYELKTYCLNVKPHRETCEVVYAKTAVDAVRSAPGWKMAQRFLIWVDPETDEEISAHAHDMDGCNGAIAIKIN